MPFQIPLCPFWYFRKSFCFLFLENWAFSPHLGRLDLQLAKRPAGLRQIAAVWPCVASAVSALFADVSCSWLVPAVVVGNKLPWWVDGIRTFGPQHTQFQTYILSGEQFNNNATSAHTHICANGWRSCVGYRKLYVLKSDTGSGQVGNVFGPQHIQIKVNRMWFQRCFPEDFRECSETEKNQSKHTKH